MDRNDYFRASKLNYEIEINEQETARNEAVAREKDLARDVLEYTRKKLNQVLRKQNQEFKNL